VARKQLEAGRVVPPVGTGMPTEQATVDSGGRIGLRSDAGSAETAGTTGATAPRQPTRYHGTVTLDATRVGRDASRIADEVIAHLAGLVGAEVTVTLEIEAEIPAGAPDHVVRTVTENGRTLKFTNQGFERE